MPRYVALLGSVNVGGNRVKMADLRAAMKEAGFGDVATVVASGNVLFDHEAAADDAMANEIAALVEKRFGFRSMVAVRTRAEIEAAVADNPFAGENEDKFVHTMFLDRPLDRKAFDAFARSYDGPERIAPGSREFYVDYGEGVARSKLGPAMDRRFDHRATARNLRSLRRIAEAMA